ncbi:hypothetical protein ANCCAN_15564 [Ancylostoma caninum]|uniref:Uncharacterized protein n=1 Tax=Ancylostoma caninum TaxID=29170 RepID=A0A368G235_ANCCA|nr:hypothetical protein ANCCAN_15564 [Ancylostoma caninum]
MDIDWSAGSCPLGGQQGNKQDRPPTYGVLQRVYGNPLAGLSALIRKEVETKVVSALMTNPRIPEQERLQKIQDLYAKIPDSIKREFDSKFINL